jgi:hypothetical protein
MKQGHCQPAAKTALIEPKEPKFSSLDVISSK